MHSLAKEQIEGAHFLAGRTVALLADKAGFGKTAQYVRACEIAGADRVTVVCPRVLRPKEADEFRQWSLCGYKSTTIIVSGDAEVPKGDGLVIVNYDLVRNERIRRKLVARGADVLILDEAHRVKDNGSKTTTAVLGDGGLQKTAARVWLATGTPTPNGAHEFFVYATLAGAWSGSYDEFIRRFCVVIDGQYGTKVVGINHANLPELHAMLRPFVLQRYAVDHNRLPLISDSVEIDGAMPALEGVDDTTLAAILRSLEAGKWELLNHPYIATARRRIGLAKAAGVVRMAADELAADASLRMLIFAEHTDVIDQIAGGLASFGVGVIDGRTSPGKTETIIRQFVPGAAGACRVAVIQRMALKEGRDMLAATRVLLAEPAWTPDDNEQMIARTYRRGQARQVRATLCRLRGSPIEAAHDRILIRKARDIESLRVQPIGP